MRSLIPPPPNPGEPLAASWGRRVVEALYALLPVAGPGIRISYTPRGAIIEAVAKPSRAAQAEPDHPFKVIDASDATGPKVRVLPGLLNAGFPTVGGQNNVFVKSDTHSANAPRLSLSGQRYWYVWLEASGIAEHEGVRLPSPEAADIFAQYDDGTFEGSSSLGPLFTSRVPLAFIELTEDLSGVSRIVQFVNGHMRCTALSMYPLQPQTVYHFFG